jgi:tripartite-type tricarboxylate transporter receptor subunit TctC
MRANLSTKAIVAIAGILTCIVAQAQQPYPSKPLRMLIGFVPGGTTDVVARVIGPKLHELLGQPVIVDNRPGAGANIAADMAAKSTPDGYTLLFVNAGLAVSASIYRHLKYDAMRDLAPVLEVAVSPHVLTIYPLLPVKSVKDLIALAKSRPGQLNFGSGGTGNSDHLAGELFNYMAGIDIVHVPYKGGTPAIADVASGQIAMYFPAVSTAWLMTKSGKVRALAVTTAKRSAFEPDLPTMSEAGVPGYEHVMWMSLFAPANTPKNIVARLNADIRKILAMPDIRERLAVMGVEPTGSSAEQLEAMLKSEIEKYGRIARAIGLSVD